MAFISSIKYTARSLSEEGEREDIVKKWVTGQNLKLSFWRILKHIINIYYTVGPY